MSSPTSRRAFLSALGALALARRAESVPGALPSPELLRLAGQCILLGWRGPTLPEPVRRRLSEGSLGGVLIARENFRGPRELRALIAEVRRCSPQSEPPPLVSADQEGGPVSHLSPAVPWTPSLTTLGGIDDLDLTRRVALAMGHHLREIGVNFNLAPVLDVRTNGANMVVFGRVFGRDPQLVARHGRAFIEALSASGVLACAKHFPGHGDTREDSHAQLPRLRHPRPRLEAVELVPFREVASVTPAVMLAHIVFDAIAPREPATLSPAHYDLLRRYVGFQGVALTDDLEMAPIRVGVGVPAAAERAIAAGADLVTIAHTPGYARLAALSVARRAERDPAFRARLDEAVGRVRAMRARAAAAPATPNAEGVAALLREVAARATRPSRRYRDPIR